MSFIASLRRLFTVLLVTVMLFAGTAFSLVTKPALAETRANNEVSNVKGDSKGINQSYHALQDAAQEYRQEFRDSASNGQKQALTKLENSPQKAAKNVGENVRSAFGKAADSVKETLDPG